MFLIRRFEKFRDAGHDALPSPPPLLQLLFTPFSYFSLAASKQAKKKWRRRSCLLRVEGQNSTRQRLSQLSSQLIVYVQSESSSSDALKCANFQSDVSLSHPAFIIPFLSHHPSKGCRVFFFLVKFAAFAMSSDFTSLLCLISLQFLC